MIKFIYASAFLLFLCSFSFAQASNGNNTGTGDVSKTQTGTEIGSDSGVVSSDGQNQPLKILSRHLPAYTEAARYSEVQGTVLLSVTFKSNGEIGKITVVKGLPKGLSKQAIKVAKKIKFVPEKKNGENVTVTKTLEYGFSLY